MSTKESASKQTSTSYTPEQQKWLGEALSVYGPQLGRGENIYQGERIAPLTGTQTSALAQGGDYLSQFSASNPIPLYGETGTALTGLLSGTTGAKELSPLEASNVFEASRATPARKTWSEYTKPTTEEAFAGPGFWSSARAGEVSKSRSDLESDLAAKRSEYLWNIEETNRQLAEAKAGRTLSAVPLAETYGQIPTQEALNRLTGTQGVFGFASAEQTQRQNELNSAIQKFAEENRITSTEDMQILLSLLGMNYSTSTGTAEGAGLGYSILSGLAGGAGAAATAKYL